MNQSDVRKFLKLRKDKRKKLQKLLREIERAQEEGFLNLCYLSPCMPFPYVYSKIFQRYLRMNGYLVLNNFAVSMNIETKRYNPILDWTFEINWEKGWKDIAAAIR